MTINLNQPTKLSKFVTRNLENYVPKRGVNLQHFAAGDPGTGDPGTPPADPGTGTGAGATPPADPGTPPAQPYAIFPDQASFMARVKREGNAQLKETLKTLGFEKLEDVQAIITAHNQKLESEKTDLQKAQDAAAAAAKAQADIMTKANQIALTSELKLQALAAGISPEKLEMALKLADVSGIEVKDGVVDSALVKEAVDKVLVALPELKAVQGTQKAGGDFSGGGQPNALTMESIKAMTPQEMESRLEEVMAFMSTQK